MEWTDEVCLQLIHLYKMRPILWDPTDRQYKMGKKKLDFWTEISKELKLDVNEVRKKMDSLLASFRRERQREASSGRSGVYLGAKIFIEAKTVEHERANNVNGHDRMSSEYAFAFVR